jgi:hypothetical protein
MLDSSSDTQRTASKRQRSCEEIAITWKGPGLKMVSGRRNLALVHIAHEQYEAAVLLAGFPRFCLLQVWIIAMKLHLEHFWSLSRLLSLDVVVLPLHVPEEPVAVNFTVPAITVVWIYCGHADLFNGIAC